MLRRLREEFVRDGKENLFEQLKPTLTEASRSVRYAEIAARLGTSEGAVKVAVHRRHGGQPRRSRGRVAKPVRGAGRVIYDLRFTRCPFNPLVNRIS